MFPRAKSMAEDIDKHISDILKCLSKSDWECASKQVEDDCMRLVFHDGRRIRTVDVFSNRLRMSGGGSTILLPLPDPNTPHKLCKEMNRIET
jgi:hypothetical protein